MRCFPIIPIWIMIIICALGLFFVLKEKNKKIVQIIIIILLFVINLRIMIPNENSRIMSNNLDVLFVIDNTISMNAEDYGNNTRLYAVKNDCKYIINKLNGARFSLINFNNSAKIAIPYTRDSNMVSEAIDILEPIGSLDARGSSLNTPIDTIISSLNSSMKKDDRVRILFFISDGEITDGSTLESYSEISKYVNNGAVMGYGTTKGGYMKSKNKYIDSNEYIKDSTNNYQIAVSKIDEDNLKKIAKDINIDYVYMDNQSKINNKLKNIENLIKEGVESGDKSTYDDIYYIFVIPLLFSLMFEFNQIRRKRI